ncbi:MAG: biopolymer transporter ExbD [Ideonella sp.]|nr:biopolymer transporter ExbD [Ideonella sp.]MCC7455852.1 biopolymer transporter ExbD [Nitrospira sp.]
MSFGRLESQRASSPLSDINVTPLVDVTLVLLVIFMITAPLMTSSLKLDLPKAVGAKPTDAAQIVTLAIDPQGRTYWGDEAVSLDALRVRVREAARRNPATEVQLRADKTVPYGRVAGVIGVVQDGGLSRVGFVTESNPPPAR